MIDGKRFFFSCVCVAKERRKTDGKVIDSGVSRESRPPNNKIVVHWFEISKLKAMILSYSEKEKKSIWRISKY